MHIFSTIGRFLYNIVSAIGRFLLRVFSGIGRGLYFILYHVLKFLCNLTYSKVLLIINTMVLISVLFITYVVGIVAIDLKRQIELYQYVWVDEINELNRVLEKTIELTTDNDSSQMRIDNRQQVEIANLTTYLGQLQKLVRDTGGKQRQVTRRIIRQINYLTSQQRRILDKLSRTKTIDLENAKNVKRANLMIFNISAGFSGSGSHIKIGENHYILTVAHLIHNANDILWAVDDNGDIYPLELTKLNKKQDIALFKVDSIEELPYLEISQEIPQIGSEVIVIGNPDHLTDVITDGVIAKVTKSYYYVTNILYFGNSGGAILYKGKIVGVAKGIQTYFKKFKETTITATYGVGTRLEVIQEFLKGIE